MKKIFVLITFIIFSINTHAARTDCPAAKIRNIQIEGQKVMYLQEGASWRTLGYLNRDDGTRERYSALLAAQASGTAVMVAYPIDNYDCSATNYGTAAYIVRTYN